MTEYCDGENFDHRTKRYVTDVVTENFVKISRSKLWESRAGRNFYRHILPDVVKFCDGVPSKLSVSDILVVHCDRPCDQMAHENKVAASFKVLIVTVDCNGISQSG